MPTTIAPSGPAPTAATPRRPAAAGTVTVRVLTVLVALTTAWITLGPRDVVTGGMAFAEGLLVHHPSLARVVDALGGVEPAGNLLLFVPLASLLALAVGFRALPVAFLLLLAAPLAVEWMQRSLPGRVPDGGDIVRNSIGLLTAFGSVALARVTVRLLLRPAR